MDRPFAVVLAGGRSRRYGSDKLITQLDGRSLLDHALDHLPADWPVIVVGPARELSRPVTNVGEQPPGGGPGAALVAGAAAVLDAGGSIMVTLAGDAPLGGLAAVRLWGHVLDHGCEAAVATDEDGRDQPLQLCLRGAALRRLTEFGDATNVRARDLLALFDPLERFALSADLTADIDTPEQAARWSARQSKS